MMGILTSIATGAVAILVTLLAIFLALKLLGKIAKFLIIVALLAFVAWLIFSENSFLREYIPFLSSFSLSDILPF